MMKKYLLSWKTILVIATFTLSPIGYADSHGPEVPTEETVGEMPTPAPDQEVVSPQEPYGDLNEDDEEVEEDENPVGTAVSTSTNDAEKSKKRQFWTNIVLASVAVIVAVVSILIVSENNG
jgi:hypothetical protein